MTQYFRPSKNRFTLFFENLSVTAAIIWLNIIFFVVTIISLYLSKDNISFLALQPNNILHGKYLWTLITHMFVHIEPLHLFFNMFALFSLGKLCEKIIGRKRFFGFYLVSGFIAGLFSVIASGFFGSGLGERIFGSSDVFMIGASGAIFGIAGLFVILLPRLKFSIIFLPFWALPAYIMIPAFLVVLWILSISLNLPVGNMAHFSGLLAGLIYGFYLKNKYKKKVYLLQRMFR